MEGDLSEDQALSEIWKALEEKEVIRNREAGWIDKFQIMQQYNMSNKRAENFLNGLVKTDGWECRYVYDPERKRALHVYRPPRIEEKTDNPVSPQG